MKFSIYSGAAELARRAATRTLLRRSPGTDRERRPARQTTRMPRSITSSSRSSRRRANVFGSLRGWPPRRTRNIKLRTMLHILPYHNPLVLASAIDPRVLDILTRGRYEFGVGRGHGWIPTAAGAAARRDVAAALRGGASTSSSRRCTRTSSPTMASTGTSTRATSSRYSGHTLPRHPRRHLRPDVRPRRASTAGGSRCRRSSRTRR